MDQLSLTFAALADPTRRAILTRLGKGEATVNELAEPFDLQLPTISKHLKVLQRAGLISQSRKAQWRPCRIEAAPLQEIAAWAESFRAHWETQFQRLDAFLVEVQREAQEAKREAEPVTRAPNPHPKPHRRKDTRHGRNPTR